MSSLFAALDTGGNGTVNFPDVLLTCGLELELQLSDRIDI